MNAVLQIISEHYQAFPDPATHPAPTVQLVPRRSSNAAQGIYTRLKCDGYPDIAPNYLRQAIGAKTFLAIKTVDALERLYALKQKQDELGEAA